MGIIRCEGGNRERKSVTVALRREGYSNVLIAVDSDNIRSIKGIERVGFSPLKRVKTTVRLGKRFVRSNPFEPKFAEPPAHVSGDREPRP